MCACLRDAGKAGEAAYLAEHLPAVALSIWSHSAIPRHYASRRLDGFQPRPGATKAFDLCTRYAEEFDASTQTGLLLIGPPGAGKTHLAVGTLYRVLERTGTLPTFWSAHELLEQDREVVRTASQADLLAIDDLGQTALPDWQRSVIYKLLDGRYSASRPTLATSNLGKADLTRVFGEAFVSRLAEMCRVITLTATDYRWELSPT